MTDPTTSNEIEKPAEEPVKSETRSERRVKAAGDALRTLIRDFYDYHFGAEPMKRDEVPLSLSLKLKPDEAWALQFDPPFPEQLHRQFEELEAGRELYEFGRVFCYRCHSATCRHSAPPVPSFVFKEYTPNGIPQWCELVQALVDAGDERVDQLYMEKPAVLARVQMGKDLKSRQLGSYGKTSKTYTILGQVIAGHFRRPAMNDQNPAQHRTALTIQVVETRGRNGRFELKLNPVCSGMTPLVWDELNAKGWRHTIGKCFDRSRRKLEEVERRAKAARVKGDPEDIRKQMKDVPMVLRDLVHSLERLARQNHRRTRHAKHRKVERPIDKAVEDALAAGMDALFFDEKKETWIACGKKGRAHVFSQEGRHVTSFVLPPGGADVRVKKKRWRMLDRVEVASFQKVIKATAGSNGDSD